MQRPSVPEALDAEIIEMEGQMKSFSGLACSKHD